MSEKVYKEFDLDIPKMGDTILVGSNGKFFGRRIVKMQEKMVFTVDQARYAHVDISGGGHRAVMIMPPRAKVIDIREAYAGRWVQIRRPWTDTPLTYMSWDRKRKHVAWVHATLCNSKYDKRGIVGFLIGWVKHHTSQWFCSEGWLYSMRKEYPEIMGNLKPEKCMPAHIAASEELQTIWEGYFPEIVV